MSRDETLMVAFFSLIPSTKIVDKFGQIKPLFCFSLNIHCIERLGFKEYPNLAHKIL